MKKFNLKMKKALARILVLAMICSLFSFRFSAEANAQSDDPITLIACSDFQNESGNTAGQTTVKNILDSMVIDGITEADGFFCCGDYDYEYTETAQGVAALKEAVSDVVTENMVFVQGNHDSAIGTAGMSPSGNNDPESGDYGVFVINEDDYMWYNSNEATIKNTAQNLIEYLNDKLDEKYDKPIFVLSHLPLHYNMRTKNDGDGMHANYIFDALNEAGEKGLNIVFMFGHNHSNGWDDYLGGASVYLKKGDEILIAQNSRTEYETETLNFTYLNAGYTGYYRNVNSGSDVTLTMTTFKISDDQILISRYDQSSLHDLKSTGVRNSYKGESAYSPNTTVYVSPESVALTPVTDSTPIEDIIEPASTEGTQYTRISSTDDLEDGGKYVLIYTSKNYIMLPEVATKANSSGSERQGFDLESTTDFAANVVYGDYTDKEWTFTKDENGWLIGDGEKYAKLTSTSSKGITATLEETGDVFTISGSGTFTFASGSYVLNYNSRGVINGYASQPASFYIYKVTGYSINVTDGTASADVAKEGTVITLTADEAPEGQVFDKWVVNAGEITLEDENSATTTFTMPAGAVEVKATYKEAEAEGEQYTRISSVDELKDGGKYVLIYTSQNSIMLPEVATKANASGSERQGFDLESTTDFTSDVVYGNYADKEWTFTKAENGWLIGDGEKYAKLTSTSSMGITATLEETGDVFTISGSGTFTFASGSYVLNYNARGVINGYASKPASFYIYGLCEEEEAAEYAINVTDGTASATVAAEGTVITLTANEAPEGKLFDKWVVNAGEITLEDENSATTTFTMPAGAVEVKATYKVDISADVAHVEGLIEAIGEVTLESEEAIEAARSAYDAASAEVKAAVTNAAVLEAAEARLAELKKAYEETVAAAKKVEEQIADLGSITLESKEAVEAAREAYEALSDEAKAMVGNLDVLELAEEKLAELEAAKPDDNKPEEDDKKDENSEDSKGDSDKEDSGKVDTDKEDANKDDSKSPATGDMASIAGLVFAMSLSLGGISVGMKKRKER